MTLLSFKIFLGGLLLLSLLNFIKTITFDHYPDFSSYYYGAEAWKNGMNPYQAQDKMFGPFLYPPFALLFFLPLTLLPYIVAEKVFLILSILSFFLAVLLLLRLVGISWKSNAGIVLLILLLNYFPAKFTLGMGQFNHVVLLLMALFIASLAQRKKTAAGLFFAVSIMLKLTPALWGVYLIYQKQVKTLVVAALALLGGFLLSGLLVGKQTFLYFFTSALPAIATSTASDYYNQSLSAFLIRTFGSASSVRVLSIGCMVALLAASFFVYARIKQKTALTQILFLSNLLILNVLFNTIAWQHHYVWLTIPLICSFAFLKRHSYSMYYWIIFGLAYFLTAINLKSPHLYQTWAQSHMVYGALLLYGLQLLILCKQKYESIS